MVATGCAVLGAGTLPATAQPAPAPAPIVIKGGGDTFSAPIINAIGFGLGKASPPVEADYAGRGSDQLSEFIDGKLDFAVSDVTLSSEEAAALAKRTQYAYAPIAAGPLVFMYNLVRQNGTEESAESTRIKDLKLSPPTLAAVFTGQVPSGQWRDPMIAADYGKPLGLEIINDRIRPVVRADASGASFILTQWFDKVAKDRWDTYTKAAKAPSGPQREYPALEPNVARQVADDGVAGFVAKNRRFSDDSGGGMTSLTYTTPANAKTVNLPVMAVKNAAGNYAQPTAEGVLSALGAAQVNADNTLTLNFDAPKADAYPLSIVSYAIVPTSGLPPEKGRALGTFLRTMATTGQTTAASLGYAALPTPLADRTLKIADQLTAQAGPVTPEPEANVSSSGSESAGGTTAQSAGSGGGGSAASTGEGLADTGSSPQGRIVALGAALMVGGEVLRRRMRRRLLHR